MIIFHEIFKTTFTMRIILNVQIIFKIYLLIFKSNHMVKQVLMINKRKKPNASCGLVGNNKQQNSKSIT